MGSVRKRLEELEARTRPERGPYGAGMSERRWEQYFHAHENARREANGLGPLPELPYTEGDYEDDLDTLESTIPEARRNPGWQGKDAQTFLDQWEQDLKEKLPPKEAG